MCGLFGVIYLIFAVCMTNYGTRLSLILTNLSESSNGGYFGTTTHSFEQKQDERDLIKQLNIRVSLVLFIYALQVVMMTGILSLIFAIRAVYNLLYTWGLIPRFFPSSLNPLFWQSIVSSFFPSKQQRQFEIIYELVPCILIILMTINEN